MDPRRFEKSRDRVIGSKVLEVEFVRHMYFVFSFNGNLLFLKVECALRCLLDAIFVHFAKPHISTKLLYHRVLVLICFDSWIIKRKLIKKFGCFVFLIVF